MQQPVSDALPQSQRFWFSGRVALGCSQGQSSPGSKQRDKPAVLGPGASLSRSDIRSSGRGGEPLEHSHLAAPSSLNLITFQPLNASRIDYWGAHRTQERRLIPCALTWAWRMGLLSMSWRRVWGGTVIRRFGGIELSPKLCSQEPAVHEQPVPAPRATPGTGLTRNEAFEIPEQGTGDQGQPRAQPQRPASPPPSISNSPWQSPRTPSLPALSKAKRRLCPGVHQANTPDPGSWCHWSRCHWC